MTDPTRALHEAVMKEDEMEERIAGMVVGFLAGCMFASGLIGLLP